MDEVEKYECFSICCCKSLKDKYRLMKTGRLTIVGEAVVTATQLSIAREGSLCRMCYLTVLIVQKALDVDTRTHTLRYKVSSAHAFLEARNEQVVSRANRNPLRIQWLHLQPERNPLPLKDIL